MKRGVLLFLIIVLTITTKAAGDDIPLNKDYSNNERHRSETPGSTPDPTFHAEVQDGNMVLVFSDTQTTYEVSIYNYNRSQLIYQGTTVNGVLHMTSTLPVGIYRIEVTTSDQSYYGTFVIRE